MLGVVLAIALIGITLSVWDPPAGDRGASERSPTVLRPLAACDTTLLSSWSAEGVTVTLDSVALTRAARGGYEVCEVRGTIAPSIGFVVQLPTTEYRQRYLQIGCGGLCGRTDSEAPQTDGCAPLTDGEFVTATNDLGHVGADGAFGREPRLRADFAYRADHTVAVVAKQLINEFYGEPPEWSYFVGCSLGGREALGEAQRYPGDFDGIVAGAPALLTTELFSLHQSWLTASTVDPSGAPILDDRTSTLLHDSVLDACDGDDGLVDGSVEDPRACRFDPRAVQCPPGQASAACLSEAQVEAALRVYSGPVDVTGRRLYPGGAAPGSELQWPGWIFPLEPGGTSGAQSLADPWLTHLADVPTPITFDEAALERVAALAGLYDAADPDLSRYRDAGGKLLIYHGWSDPAIPPLGTLAYRQAVLDAMGGQAGVSDFLRLYMIPGLGHCVDGEGPDSFDALTPMLRWVEHGVAPHSLVAVDHDTGRARPIFPYPHVARYLGHGSIDDVGSFESVAPPHVTDDRLPWLGSWESREPLWLDGGRLTRTRPEGE